MSSYEIAKEITVALVNKLGAQNAGTLETSSKAIGEAFKTILKAINESS
jgi:hypothetical protein